MGRSRTLRVDSLEQFTAINYLSDPGAVGGDFIMPNGINVIIRYTLTDGKQANNILWAQVASAFAITPTICDNLFAAITTGAAWVAFAAVISTTTSVSAVLMRDRRQLGLLPISSTIAARAGTNAGIALPNEVALVGTIRTDKGGPGGRGRIYVPGFAVDQVTAANAVAPGCMTAVQNWLALINSAMSGGGMVLSLGLGPRQAYTGITGTQHPARTPQMLPVRNIVVRDNHWDSQRRRGLK